MITFTSVFVILFFIFVLQGIWLFIADLAGKDLDAFTVVKFLSFYAPTIVPLTLPLSIVLASIMTFGGFAENYEFAAMKASGISLQRAMKKLVFTIGIISIISFIFANNVIPEAQYRFLNLRKDIIKQKPAMVITEKQFNTIGNISIKVDKKYGDNKRFLENVIMHIKNTQRGLGANTVIKAKKGELKNSSNDNLLQLELINGNYYENIIPKKFVEQKKQPFVKSSFKKYKINIDLSKFDKTTNEQKITSEKMLTITELNYTIDSLQKHYKKDILSYTDNIVQRTNGIVFTNQQKNTIKTPKTTELLNLFSTISNKQKIIKNAISTISGNKFSIQNSTTDLAYKKKRINKHWIAFHEKIMIAYSCLLMFFIGAPLGAIIRKGGVGLPMVFAIIVFISFHFINTFGRKLAQEDSISPFLGVWLASIILTPLAIVLTNKATKDRGISIDFNWIIIPVKKIFTNKKTTHLSN